jgi:glycosyltransferase involved in cell wall biosynthesis
LRNIISSKNIYIVIPAFNEELTISSVVAGCIKYGQVLVVDDGSTDLTAENAELAGALVIKLYKNHGYENALNKGFSLASSKNAEIIITFDADGQHPPFIIKRLIKIIQNGFDVVCGVRHKKQRVSEVIFSYYTNFFYGILDPLCGLKAYKVGLYRKLGYFDSFGSSGTELLLFAAKNKYKIFQLKFPIKERVGASRFGSSFSGNCKILRALILNIFYINRNS